MHRSYQLRYVHEDSTLLLLKIQNHGVHELILNFLLNFFILLCIIYLKIILTIPCIEQSTRSIRFWFLVHKICISPFRYKKVTLLFLSCLLVTEKSVEGLVAFCPLLCSKFSSFLLVLEVLLALQDNFPPPFCTFCFFLVYDWKICDFILYIKIHKIFQIITFRKRGNQIKFYISFLHVISQTNICSKKKVKQISCLFDEWTFNCTHGY